MSLIGHSFTIERWRCTECGTERGDWKIGCVKCYGDLERFEVVVVPADQLAGAVGMLEQIATDLERELDVGGQMPTVFPDEIRALLARIAPQTRA